MDADSSIARFYDGRSVLITGASGFLGKVLLEKLLRSCPGLKQIFVLMRAKRKKDPEERLKDLLSSKIFDRLKDENSLVFDKIVCVTGDISLPDFGISETQMPKIIDNVSIIFHSAATVRYDEPLKKAVSMNVIAVRNALELCRKLNNLEALVHVSTSFCYCHMKHIDEEIYETSFAPQRIIDMVKYVSDDTMVKLTPEILDNCPNTYIFTKALAENLIASEHGSVPVAIVRPSTVGAAWKEPYPGWVDSINGPAGTGIAGGKGVLRTMVVNGDMHPNIVPVDVVSNLMIVLGWHTARLRSNDVTVYNCTSANSKQLSWDEILNLTYPMYLKCPSSELYWYPASGYERSKILSRTFEVLFHYFPAVLIDMIAYMTFQKPGMVKMYQRIHKLTHGYEFFTTKQWTYGNKNVLTLSDELSADDKEVFYCEDRSLDWRDYWQNHIFGCRKYLLKEDPKTIPEARKKLRRLYIISRILYALCAYGAWKIFSNSFLSVGGVRNAVTAVGARIQGVIPIGVL